jgi:hypothetical protein
VDENFSLCPSSGARAGVAGGYERGSLKGKEGGMRDENAMEWPKGDHGADLGKFRMCHLRTRVLALELSRMRTTWKWHLHHQRRPQRH